MRINGLTDADRTADPPPFVSPTFPVLLSFEGGQNVLEGPTGGTVAFPIVVVARGAAGPHHGVDGAAATQDAAECHIDWPIVQLRYWSDWQRPVKGAADIIEPDAGVGERRAGIFTAGLDNENLSARLGNLAGNDGTGRAAPNDDVVICRLRLRLVARLGSARSYRLLRHVRSWLPCGLERIGALAAMRVTFDMTFPSCAAQPACPDSQ